MTSCNFDGRNGLPRHSTRISSGFGEIAFISTLALSRYRFAHQAVTKQTVESHSSGDAHVSIVGQPDEAKPRHAPQAMTLEIE